MVDVVVVVWLYVVVVWLHHGVLGFCVLVCWCVLYWAVSDWYVLVVVVR